MKAPVNPYRGHVSSGTDPDEWSGFKQAKWAKERGCDGLGFVLNGDGIVAINLDHCVSRDRDRFQIHKPAGDVVHSLNSYTEFSPSRKGIHIWLFGCLPKAGRRNDAARIEIYTNWQYVRVTGVRVPGCADVLENRVMEVFTLYRRFFPNGRNFRPWLPRTATVKLFPNVGRWLVGSSSIFLHSRSPYRLSSHAPARQGESGIPVRFLSGRLRGHGVEATEVEEAELVLN